MTLSGCPGGRTDLDLDVVVNGKRHALTVGAHETVAQVLRERLGLTGTKVACDVQVCGACTVLLDGQAISACTVLAFQVAGGQITTIEGLAGDDGLHPLQEAFLLEGGLQCGYCTPGMIMAAKALLDERPDPSAAEVRAGLEGNLCRCTGYQAIVESVRRAATLCGGHPRAPSLQAGGR